MLDSCLPFSFIIRCNERFKCIATNATLIKLTAEGNRISHDVMKIINLGMVPFTIILFVFLFLFVFTLFYFGCDMCFPKTFKRFWHDCIDNLILFAEIQSMLCFNTHAALRAKELEVVYIDTTSSNNSAPVPP